MNVLFAYSVRHEVRKVVREDYPEVGLFQRLLLVRRLTDEAIKKAADKYETVPKEFLVAESEEAIGDGSILKAIFGWLGSPEGQNFIKFIIAIIMGGVIA